MDGCTGRWVYEWVDDGIEREKKKLVARQSMAQVGAAFRSGLVGGWVYGWVGG